MQIRSMCALVLSALLLSTPGLATEMSPNTRQMWLQDRTVINRVELYMDHAEHDRVDDIIYDTERLTLEQQEAVRYLFLQTMERKKTVISQSLASYLEQLVKIPPVFQLHHIGDGYEFSTPAFAYPSIANRLLKQWQRDQTILSFLLAAEREELHLETWLNDGTQAERQAREKLFIAELDGLSPPALNLVVEQVVDANDKVIFWLPSSAVMVRLAQVSGDHRVYRLLWRMRADNDIQKELFRLMDKTDDYTVDLIMQAAENSRLETDAIEYLAALRPMPGKVKGFLLDKLSSTDYRGVVIATKALIRNGHRSWLINLMEGDSKVNRIAIEPLL